MGNEALKPGLECKLSEKQGGGGVGGGGGYKLTSSAGQHSFLFGLAFSFSGSESSAPAGKEGNTLFTRLG